MLARLVVASVTLVAAFGGFFGGALRALGLSW
jgi:hypothetical protein